jgi:hypothetical protein
MKHQPPAHLGDRFQRIALYHAAARASAGHFKIYALLTGLELQCLKVELGIVSGTRTDLKKETSETVSEVPADDILNGRSWGEFVEDELDLTARTANNYVNAYMTIIHAAPKVCEKLIAAARVKRDTATKALPDHLSQEDALDLFQPRELEDLVKALDPWTLSELYEKPLKRIDRNAHNEIAREQNDKKQRQIYFDFWLDPRGTVGKQVERKTYLKLPRPERQRLLETLDIVRADLRESLRGVK